MLTHPYTTYDRLYVYNLALAELPVLTDPDLIGAWVEDEEAVLFFHREKKELIAEICRRTGGSLIYEADLDYRDWEAGHAISAFSVGDFTVAPVWDPEPADIRLDPSVIFGSGFHPTTRLCLEALLEQLAAPAHGIVTNHGMSHPGVAYLPSGKRLQGAGDARHRSAMCTFVHGQANNPADSVDGDRSHGIESMLDLGSGTGLLAIAAARKGVASVTAVDHNSLACELAAANAERNGVADRIDVRRLDLRHECPDTRVDLVVANLYRVLLEGLFQNPDFWQARRYIISGFVPAMEPDLLAAIPARGLKFLARRRRELWCLWLLEKKTC